MRYWGQLHVKLNGCGPQGNATTREKQTWALNYEAMFI
jgi:hypothetical protein